MTKVTVIRNVVLFAVWSFVVSGKISSKDRLALTPPMGWLSWARFMCQIDCRSKPKSCISENLFVEMANRLVQDGYRDAGYNRINIDDCWAAKERDPNTQQLVADPERFPHGIPWLAGYVHEMGLKLGIYSNFGARTCMGFAGTPMDRLETDAKTFASWGIDMLKLDGCFRNPATLVRDMNYGYPKMAEYLNQTGRDIVFSCSWPYYVRFDVRQEPDYKKIVKHCHLWRNFKDIQISWRDVLEIIEFYEKEQEYLGKFHGPGHWNDPDMLIIGNRGLTVEQARAQMAFWCLWSAPLLMSNDLREVDEPFRRILTNRRLIAVDQDPLGIMGRKVGQRGRLTIYMKPMTPVQKKEDGTVDYSYAIVFFNKDASALVEEKVSLRSIGLKRKEGYVVQDLFTDEYLNASTPDSQVLLRVNPNGVIVWKATLISIYYANEKLLDHSFNYSGLWMVYGISAAVLLLVLNNRRKLRRKLGLH